MRAATLLILLALLSTPILQEPEPPMIGYTGFYLLPMLDGGLLVYEVGEEVWAMATEAPASITLTSPTGAEETHTLEPGKPTLIKVFEPGDEPGDWALESGGSRLVLRLVEEPGPAGAVEVAYGLRGGVLEARIAEPRENAFFLGAPGGRVLLAAGVKQEARLGGLGLPEGEVVADLLYPDGLEYSGALAGRPYRLDLEAVAARLVGELDDGVLKLMVPGLHEVGAGGVVPVRRGEAILRLRSGEEVREVDVYVAGREI